MAVKVIFIFLIAIHMQNVFASRNMNLHSTFTNNHKTKILESQKIQTNEVLYNELNQHITNEINKIDLKLDKLEAMILDLARRIDGSCVSIANRNNINEEPKNENQPRKPQFNIDMETNYFLVELNKNSINYKDLVKRHESVNVTVKWNNPVYADKTSITLDNVQVWSSKETGTTASFAVDKGGRYMLKLEHCNFHGCSSDTTELVVADTDGSHLPFTNYSKPYKNTHGKVIGASLLEWKFEDESFAIDRIRVLNLTHLRYKALMICGGYPWVDRDSCKGLDIGNIGFFNYTTALLQPRPGIQFYNGSFGELIMLKQTNPDMKILATIEMDMPQNFFSDKDIRDTFITSLNEFLKTWKMFDGIDLYWDDLNSSKCNQLDIQIITELREMLNQLTNETGRKYEMTISAEPYCLGNPETNYKEADNLVDYFFIEYSFRKLPPNINVHHPTSLFDVDLALSYLKSQNVHTEKLVPQVSMVGLGWLGLQDFKDSPLNGTPKFYKKRVRYSDYTEIMEYYDQGVWDYYFDNKAQGPYLFHNVSGNLVAYDDPRSVAAKANFVKRHNLGGLIASRLMADNGVLLGAMKKELGDEEQIEPSAL